MKKMTVLGMTAALALLLILYNIPSRTSKGEQPAPPLDTTFFEIQSIDTMKYSRDMAREKLEDEAFDAEIEAQMSSIAEMGATHVALGTPYDEEFLPFLKRWVSAARRHNLKVWYRGNFSGWEEWFGYSRIDREEHMQMVKEFISNNPDLFEDGDIFVSCPECENGGPGDPRMNGNVEGHRAFLIAEYETTVKAFEDIGKEVRANLYSMNGDVAELIMDRETTSALGGVVTIDHYVADHDRMIADIQRMQQKSGGQIVLGEYGGPIPDIHGPQTPQEQAAWLDEGMKKLLNQPHVLGINYWVGKGGSTAIWEEDNERKPAADVLARYYNPQIITGTVTNTAGRRVDEVIIQSAYVTTSTQNGVFSLRVLDDEEITFEKANYYPVQLNAKEITDETTIQMKRIDTSWTDYVRDFFYTILP